MRDVLEQKLDILRSRLDEVRDEVADADAPEIESVEHEYHVARERIDALGEETDDLSDLALREAARAIDELGNRLDQMTGRTSDPWR